MVRTLYDFEKPVSTVSQGEISLRAFMNKEANLTFQNCSFSMILSPILSESCFTVYSKDQSSCFSSSHLGVQNLCTVAFLVVCIQ
jgi:hypothetical protein